MSIPADISVWIEKLSAARLPVRRASMDASQQLQQTLKRPVNRLICVAADPDPTLDFLPQIFRTKSADVHTGLSILGQFVPGKCLIVDHNQLRRLGTYPSLEPSLMIRRLLGRKLAFGALPTDAGVMLIDVLTAAQIGLLARGQEVEQLPVVLDNHLTHKRTRMNVSIYATVGEVMQQCEIDLRSARLQHGMVLQKRFIQPEARIADTELWLHILPEASSSSPATCTRCGECVNVCPVLLQPAGLLESAQYRNVALGDRFHVHTCIECGLCDDVCPSSLPLLGSIRQLKALAS